MSARRESADDERFSLRLETHDGHDTPLKRQANPIFVFALLTIGFSVVGGALQMLNRPLSEVDSEYLQLALTHVAGNLLSSLIVISLLLIARRKRDGDERLPYLLVAAGGLIGGVVRLPFEAWLAGPIGVRSVPWSILAEGAWFLIAGLITRIVNGLARGELEARGRLLAAIERERSARAAMLRADVTLRRDIAEWAHGRLQSELLRAALNARKLGAAGNSLADQLDALREEELRPLAKSLHPAVAEVDLRTALQQLALRHAPECRIELRIHEDSSAGTIENRTRLQSLALPIYRMVEEGVANAIRHGQAAHVNVNLSVHPSMLELRVSDNGRGVAGPPEPGLGSGIIDSWVRSVEGSWQLSFPTNGGAELRARLPLPRTSSAKP